VSVDIFALTDLRELTQTCYVRYQIINSYLQLSHLQFNHWEGTVSVMLGETATTTPLLIIVLT